MNFIRIDKALLVAAIASGTDASEADARAIVNTVLARQKVRHVGECDADSDSMDVCDSIYADKTKEVIDLCEVLRAVLALTGEDPQVRELIETALRDHD